MPGWCASRPKAWAPLGRDHHARTRIDGAALVRQHHRRTDSQPVDTAHRRPWQQRSSRSNQGAADSPHAGPLDGAPLVEAILRSAGAFAKAMDADITLLRVVASATLQNAASVYLETVADQFEGRFEGANADQCRGQPGVAILAAAKPPIDLIAIEKHGRSGVSSLLLGSVTEKVIRGSHLPILVKKPKT